jgi:hypothetical protein
MHEISTELRGVVGAVEASCHIKESHGAIGHLPHICVATCRIGMRNIARLKDSGNGNIHGNGEVKDADDGYQRRWSEHRRYPQEVIPPGPNVALVGAYK